MLGALLRITGLASKFLVAHFARKLVPIDLGRFQRAARQGLFHAALIELLLYSARTVATRSAATDEGVGKAAVLLQAFFGQVVERDGDFVVLETLVLELAFKLAATMLAAGQRADREVAR